MRGCEYLIKVRDDRVINQILKSSDTQLLTLLNILNIYYNDKALF